MNKQSFILIGSSNAFELGPLSAMEDSRSRNHLFPFFRLEFKSMVEDSYTPIAQEKKNYDHHPAISLAKDDVIHSSSPIRNLNFPSYDESPRSNRRHIDSLLNNSSPRLNVSLGMKCCAKTKSGSRCKNSALNLSTTCRVHTPQKDL